MTATLEAPAPAAEATPENVIQAMAEADTLRALTRTGGVRLVKRAPIQIRPEITPPSARTESLPTQAPVPPPESAPESKTEPVAPTPDAPTPSEAQPSATAPKPASGLRRPHFRRKARLTDLARMILPSKREEPPATIVPPSFPVEIPAGTVLRAEGPKPVKDAAPDVSTPEKTPGEAAPAENPAQVDGKIPTVMETSGIPVETTHATGPEKAFAPEIKTAPAAVPVTPAVPFPTSGPAAATPKAETVPPSTSLSTPPAPGEKREFLLANGERILGRVLSETHDSVYIEHTTLGVLTLPRAQIAKRLVELILINGDRIVGDIVAETPECLFVRHASLGMLTVPQAQRSTRVVEAILKDGDRIVGEVLAETETYTVIRSATLGTVTVQHKQLAMLNRKVEQVALKALPPAQPALENRPSA
jgi:RNase P/RNase MRP subunit p29